MAAKPVEPVESVTRSEVESLGMIELKVMQRLKYAKVLKEEVGQRQATLDV